MSNLIDLEDYKLKKEEAKLAVYLQEVRGHIVRQRQGSVLMALHYLLSGEEEYGLLTKEEIIEIAAIFARQVQDGVVLS
jgi:hypothetical protein